ncbi:MAG: hypothetical protein ACXWJZ_01240 [Burkholderiaceae bacterium]
MPFDLASAKPFSQGFDLSTMKPVDSANVPDTGTFFGNILPGVGKAFTDIGLGAKQRMDEGANYLEKKINPSGSFSTAVGMPTASDVLKNTQDQVIEKRQLDAPLMATSGGKVGTIIGGGAIAAPAMFIPGGQTLAGSILTGAGLGAAQPTTQDESVLKNALVGGAGGAAGYGVGKGLSYLANKNAVSAATKASQNALVDTNIQAARDAGYVIPPSQSNPSSIIANTADILAGGRPKMAQAASLKNQSVTNNLAAKALDLPENTPITKDVLNTVRQNAFNNGYLPVKSAGTVTPTQAYIDALDKIEAPSLAAAKSFPSGADTSVSDMVNGLRVPSFDAGHAVDKIALLRASANKAYAAGDSTLGKASKDAANALEDALDQHLSSNGMTDALSNFRDARTQIAKSFSLEKAINDTTGSVSATKLGGQLKAGKPLSDELLQIARASQLPGKSLQDMSYATPGASQLESAASVGGAIAAPSITLKALSLGIPYARAGLRNALLSDSVQGAMSAPTYESSKLLGTLASPVAQRIYQMYGQSPQFAK